ncbi:DUF262 domain-containing HNH endonuclease family protein [Nostoc sp. FACHB-888]|uniref:DUF262 domain-containing HNH endonuclease family protein n=1 Tax=Nostoc sp. FACHB-888 TaxID=2692842 RepID=UPI0016853497|nr:DUF262 domain-containing HNH endonuclease family protein [Nostoc sp. FACHB-888]MBD2243392.1 DUF262 domain-containing protein [Nostoc sp. FACHB-888]
MDKELYSLSKIFTEKLYRIPDYQRGYAWNLKQLKDFWNDLEQLGDKKNHYLGVLTLEEVSNEVINQWQNDSWIIQSKGYDAYYIVDGQQRLTTSIILIQGLIECTDKNTKLNYNTIEEIRKKYISDSKDGGISISYIFGYEKDNPSYEFLKTNFQNYTPKEKNILKNSLGNLLPLSSAKNSSFSNKSFLAKKGNEINTIGYRYGSFSENEVANYEHWTAKEILKRGIDLLNFMEERWQFSIGNEQEKIEFLGIGFVLKKEGLSH